MDSRRRHVQTSRYYRPPPPPRPPTRLVHRPYPSPHVHAQATPDGNATPHDPHPLTPQTTHTVPRASRVLDYAADVPPSAWEGASPPRGDESGDLEFGGTYAEFQRPGGLGLGIGMGSRVAADDAMMGEETPAQRGHEVGVGFLGESNLNQGEDVEGNSDEDGAELGEEQVEEEEDGEGQEEGDDGEGEGGEDGEDGEDGEEGEEAEEAEEEGEDGEESDVGSQGSSAMFDPDADPEGWARRLDEIAGMMEVSEEEARALRWGPVTRKGDTPLLPLDQFKRLLNRHLDQTEWKYATPAAQGSVGLVDDVHVHPVRVVGLAGWDDSQGPDDGMDMSLDRL